MPILWGLVRTELSSRQAWLNAVPLEVAVATATQLCVYHPAISSSANDVGALVVVSA